jgi:SAM-dependent methyltransferase
MGWQKYLIVPRLIVLGARAPRDQGRAWDLFWSRVHRTGPGGDALWDLGSEAEAEEMLGRVRAHLDLTLPVVDVGCGNGRQTRLLATSFPRAVGLDVSRAAIARAQNESEGVSGVEYRVIDVSQPGAVEALAGDIGPANVHIRGVFHLLGREQQRVAADNLRELVGEKGRVYIVETDFDGDSLDHLEYQGATAGTIPEPLRLCIASGVRPPAHFSEREVEALFPASRWDRVAGGSTVLHTLPMHNRGHAEEDELRAYWAVLGRR